MTGTEGTRTVLRAFVLVFLAIAGVPLPLTAAEADVAGPGAAPRVASVAFRVASPYRLSYEELSGLVPLRPGDPLDPERVRAGIRNLYKKTVFREVRAYVREEDGEAQVLFFLVPVPAVSQVEVRGNREVPSSEILRASGARRGMLLEGNDLAATERRVRDLLRKRGFPRASVSVSVDCNLGDGSGRVRIEVREGEAAVVRSVNAPGASHFPEEELYRTLGATPGEPFDFRKWEKGIRKLRGAYKRDGFLTVDVGEATVDCPEGEETLCLTLPVEEGPRYGVSWTGPKRFSRKKLEQASGIYSETDEFTESALVYDLRERLLAFYRARDHHQAVVAVEATGEEADARRLAIVVEEGKKGFLKRIRFEGNEGIPEKTLKRQMLSRERALFSSLTGSGKFDEAEWESDLLAVVGLYQKEGFADARIVSVEREWGRDGGLLATIRIEEGPRYRVREIRIRGNDHFLREELLALAGNREGRFADFPGIERDRQAILDHYRNAGYLDVEVQAEFSRDKGGETAALSFAIREGTKYRLGKVLVQGNLLTDSETALRELRVQTGETVGEKDLISFQREMYGTGLYKSIRLTRVRRSSEGILDLVVEVEEAMFLELEAGAGYGTDTGIRGSAGATHRNLDGKGRRVSLLAGVSQKEQNYSGELREPWILGKRWKVDGNLSLSYQEREQESFSSRKTSFVAGLSRTFFGRSSVAIQYDLSLEKTFDVDPGAILSPEDQGKLDIAVLRLLSVLDLRDDPFNPRRGHLNSATAEWASKVLGSEVDYYRLTAQSTWYFTPFRRNTVALSLRGGVALPLADSVQVPIQKRFFLGGRTTVRGFEEESIGPVGPDGSPTGGNYMVNTNLEYRVEMVGNFYGAVFLDTGSVWLSGPGGDFDLREGAGVGLLYITPVGPIRFDYGWKLDRKPGESPSEWHFTIGAAF